LPDAIIQADFALSLLHSVARLSQIQGFLQQSHVKHDPTVGVLLLAAVGLGSPFPACL